jgi:hypothetical protein
MMHAPAALSLEERASTGQEAGWVSKSFRMLLSN